MVSPLCSLDAGAHDKRAGPWPRDNPQRPIGRVTNVAVSESIMHYATSVGWAPTRWVSDGAGARSASLTTRCVHGCREKGGSEVLGGDLRSGVVGVDEVAAVAG